MTTPKRRFLTSVVFALVFGISAMTGLAQTTAPTQADDTAVEVPTAPVVIDGVTLFRVRGIQAYPADQRAGDITGRIVALAKDPAFAVESLAVIDTDQYAQIMRGPTRIVVVTDADARIEGVRRSNLAWSLAATILFAAFLLVVRRAERRLRARAERRYRGRVHDVQIKSIQVVRAERVWHALGGLVNLLWVAAALAATFVYLHFVLRLFPWTRGLGVDLGSIVAVPLRVIGGGALAIIPNLVFLAVLVIVTRYLLKLIKLFFDAIAAGQVTFENFEPDWAMPTYRLVRILVVAFAVIVAYPYIPGSRTEAFKGVSLFVGVVFSLGSSAFIGNMIAGFSMTYRRASTSATG